MFYFCEEYEDKEECIDELNHFMVYKVDEVQHMFNSDWRLSLKKKTRRWIVNVNIYSCDMIKRIERKRIYRKDNLQIMIHTL